MIPMLPRPAGIDRPHSRNPQFPARVIVLVIVIIAATYLVGSGLGVVDTLAVVAGAALTAEAVCDRLDLPARSQG